MLCLYLGGSFALIIGNPLRTLNHVIDRGTSHDIVASSIAKLPEPLSTSNDLYMARGVCLFAKLHISATRWRIYI
jgi:hypothetical protein